MPDPRFVQTECEVIQSEAILDKVIENLDLNKQWGKQFAGGERLKTSESIAMLKGRIDVRPIRNTSIIEIRAFSERPEEAANIANAIAEAYRAYRREQASRLARQSNAALAESVTAPVEIIDTAKPGIRPVRPNKPLNITLGVMMGVLLGLVIGGGVWLAGLALGSKPGANPQR